MTYTDTQLKQALAKMLPEQTKTVNDGSLFWNTETDYREIYDTELLHLCWLVEEEIWCHTGSDDYAQEVWNQYTYHLAMLMEPNPCRTHATWQQRTIALAKVKGVEIV